MRAVVALLRETATRWVDDRCYRLGAALAYYAIFSLFPLLLLSVTVLGYALGDGASTRNQLLDSLNGPTGSPAVRQLLDQTLTSMQDHRTARGIGAIVGLLTLVFGASGVFSELSSSLNTIWRVKDPVDQSPWQSVKSFVKDKAFSFGLVGAAGVLVIASLVISTGLSALSKGKSFFPWGAVEAVTSTLFLTVALAAMFKILPQMKVAWRDVFGGAFVAAVLLTVLRRLLAYYLAHMGSYAAYGAIGAVLGLMSLIYISSLVMFYGAEFTRVFAEHHGSLKGVRKPKAEAAAINPLAA